MGEHSQQINAYFNETHLQPLAAAMLVLLGLYMLAARRRNALLPMVVMACFVSQAQRVAIASLNFDLLRILVLVGGVRILLRQEWRGFRTCRLDAWFVAWVGLGFLTTMILDPTAEALKYRLGFTYEAIGMYFLFRVLIRTWDDVHQFALQFATVAVPVAALFVFEHVTGRNLFAVFGGLPEFTGVRDGRFRCQGAFSHPILAGCFWAGVMPIMAVQWWRGGRPRWRGVAGVLAACVIVVMCASSTPVSSVAVGMVGAAMFLLRRHLNLVRWGIVATLVVMHLSMTSPVWHIVSRLDLAGGSTGWHRFHLIDAFVNHFSEWWVVGRVNKMEGWGWGLWDVTNYYIVQGLNGGLLLLLVFVAMIASAFASVGRMVRDAADDAHRRYAWALGVCLLIHAINFLAVTYFGQIVMLWYLALATIGSMSVAVRPPIARRRKVVRVARRAGTRDAKAPAFAGAGSVLWTQQGGTS